MRDNGAISGGAAAFSVGDSVVVLKKYDGSKVYVVGLTAGIKSCYWEPWNGPDINTLHPWEQYLLNTTTNPWSITGGKVYFDLTNSSPINRVYTLLWIPLIPDPKPDIPASPGGIRINITATITRGTAVVDDSIVYVYVKDESSNWIIYYVAVVDYVVTPPSVYVGNQDGLTSLVLTGLSGKVKQIQIGADLWPGSKIVYNTDFVTFK